ncbi:hypothetical protein DMN91_007889 [Ooceraea biroi]|uniref:C-type lectin domain-containing protein n=2 Tax=Ooceraea biroi TaxID=2015173 RepID=A0A026WCB6_OOCBI|nr:uncharacterized protein LOC105280740 isoform X1 [Ooceraea biroi]EZA53707.1 hypothetical protein X777_06814 [Ooceraea biroi]RLU19332.1 hypothetical protein DMN91_007889 [Ooceraea biroi]
MKIVLVLLVVAAFASAQRITTIQLDGIQYFVSRMNPYSPELNYFLAYQYCRSLGLQLASFETKEKADTMTQYLKNAGYTKYDFWTSGNKLGTDMFLWMSTGLPFNVTFDYMLKRPGNRPADVPPGTEPQRVARESGDSGSADGCVAMMAPTLAWEAQDCTLIKDFICEQTRCYYYNYGSIPVSATQGNHRPYITTTSAPASDDPASDHEIHSTNIDDHHPSTDVQDEHATPSETDASADEKLLEDPVVSRLITTAAPAPGNQHQQHANTASAFDDGRERERSAVGNLDNSRPEHIPDIASLFTEHAAVASQARKDSVFAGLETREILRPSASRPAISSSSSSVSSSEMRMEHRESPDYGDLAAETELPNNGLEDSHTIGPYDSVQDYVNDQPADVASAADSAMMKDQDDDSSTILPEAEPAYRYNIKVRTNGKVLDPPSK